MVIFTIIFGKVAKLPSHGVPYAIMVFVAVLPWQFFANALSEGSGSLLANANLLTKVYFPRLIMPTSSVIVSLIDFFISALVLALIMCWYHYVPNWRIVTIPLFLAVACLFALGVGYWLAALNVKYRDFRYVVPFMIQLGLYISPIGFSSSIIPAQWRIWYSLNPMVGVIDGFRWAIIYDGALYVPGFILSCAMVMITFFLGLRYFRKVERTFADII
jgi:lipopolysaccharide transport system permease protein